MRAELRRAFEAVEARQAAPPARCPRCYRIAAGSSGPCAGCRQTARRRRLLAVVLTVVLIAGMCYGIRRGQGVVDAWERHAEAAARHTTIGNFIDAETELSALETELDRHAPWTHLPGFAGQRGRLETQAAKQRQELDERRDRYTATLAAAFQAVRAPLALARYDDALEVLTRAAGKDGDPVLDSVATFVKHRKKLDRPWEASDNKVIDALLRESLEWKSARSAHDTDHYVNFLAIHPDTPYAEEAKARIVDLEVADIVKGEHGALPTASTIQTVAGRTYSVINVHNDTEYDLTLRYSGPDSFKVVLAPRERAAVEVMVGKYEVTASVNAAHVRNYAGKSESRGDNSQVSYYIDSPVGNNSQSQTSFLPENGNDPSRFAPLTCKRKVPDYLK